MAVPRFETSNVDDVIIATNYSVVSFGSRSYDWFLSVNIILKYVNKVRHPAIYETGVTIVDPSYFHKIVSIVIEH